MPSTPEVADKTKNSVTLTWTPPEKDGGSPIKGYIIEKQDEGTSEWTRVNGPDALHPTTEFTVPNLPELKRYRFRVIAVNDIGESEPSPRTTEVLIKELQGNNHEIIKMHPHVLVTMMLIMLFYFQRSLLSLLISMHLN